MKSEGGPLPLALQNNHNYKFQIIVVQAHGYHRHVVTGISYSSYTFDVLEVAKKGPQSRLFGVYPCGDLNVVEDFRPAANIVEPSQISRCPWFRIQYINGFTSVY